jgi:ABC-2 type transport system ATP-binding protein
VPERTRMDAMLDSSVPGAAAPVPRDGAPVIDAQHLTRRFRSVTAVDDLTLEIPQGQLFGLVGPDGAGKSTLIKMLATVLPPTSGDALVFGTSIVKRPHDIKSRIGYMSQKFSLYGDLTVRENLDFFAKLRGVPRSERESRAGRLLEFAGLTEFVDRPAEFLSGGMKQKLALAATLIHEPDLIFLDEPTTGVDPVSRREFWRIISDLHSRGITVVVATPYMDEAERCGEIAFLEQGRILVRDTPAGLKARVPGRLYEVAVDDYQAAVKTLTEVPGVLAADQYGELVRVVSAREDGPGTTAIERALEAAGIAVRSVREAPVSMETAFAMLVKRSGEAAAAELAGREDV